MRGCRRHHQPEPGASGSPSPTHSKVSAGIFSRSRRAFMPSPLRSAPLRPSHRQPPRWAAPTGGGSGGTAGSGARPAGHGPAPADRHGSARLNTARHGSVQLGTVRHSSAQPARFGAAPPGSARLRHSSPRAPTQPGRRRGCSGPLRSRDVPGHRAAPFQDGPVQHQCGPITAPAPPPAHPWHSTRVPHSPRGGAAAVHPLVTPQCPEQPQHSFGIGSRRTPVHPNTPWHVPTHCGSTARPSTLQYSPVHPYTHTSRLFGIRKHGDPTLGLGTARPGHPKVASS